MTTEQADTGERLARLETQVEAVMGLLTRMETAIREDLREVHARIDRVEIRIDRVETRIDQLHAGQRQILLAAVGVGAVLAAAIIGAAVAIVTTID